MEGLFALGLLELVDGGTDFLRTALRCAFELVCFLATFFLPELESFGCDGSERTGDVKGSVGGGGDTDCELRTSFAFLSITGFGVCAAEV